MTENVKIKANSTYFKNTIVHVYKQSVSKYDYQQSSYLACDIEDMVGDSVGENCFGCCQRDSPPLGTMSGLSWALFRDVVPWARPVTRGEPEGEEEEQEGDPPIPLL